MFLAAVVGVSVACFVLNSVRLLARDVHLDRVGD